MARLNDPVSQLDALVACPSLERFVEPGQPLEYARVERRVPLGVDVAREGLLAQVIPRVEVIVNRSGPREHLAPGGDDIAFAMDVSVSFDEPRLRNAVVVEKYQWVTAREFCP